MNNATNADPGCREFSIMADRLGVDPGTRVAARSAMLYSGVLQRCRGCPAKAECRALLDQKCVTLAAASAFCPSSETLFELLHHGVRRCA